MVITSRTYTTLFGSSDPSAGSNKLVRLPLSVAPQYETRCHITGAVVLDSRKPLFRSNLWSSDEHERFLHGLELFPNGPWKEVAQIVGTKSTRQTMTHAQKYRQKIERHLKAKPKKIKSRRPTAVHPCPLSITKRDSPVITKPDLSIVNVVSSPADVSSELFDPTALDHVLDSIFAELEPLVFHDDTSTLYTTISL